MRLIEAAAHPTNWTLLGSGAGELTPAGAAGKRPSARRRLFSNRSVPTAHPTGDTALKGAPGQWAADQICGPNRLNRDLAEHGANDDGGDK